MPVVNRPSTDRSVAVVVLAKLPVPGLVKTRLCPPCTPDEAAGIAEASLRDTLAAVSLACRAHPGILGRITISIERHGHDLPEWIAAAGQVIDQCPGDLGIRLAQAFASVDAPAILIGMDTPQVTPDLLREVAMTLRAGDSVIGPATDGGYWMIGFRDQPPKVFAGVPMSTDQTGLEQVLAMKRHGLDPSFAPPLTDFDVFEDAKRIARNLDGSHFQRAVDTVASRLTRVTVPPVPTQPTEST